MDPLVAWGTRVASGAFAFLGLIYFAIWMDRGGREPIVAAVLLLVAAGATAYVVRHENV